MKTNFLKDIILMITIAAVTGLTACNNKPEDATEMAEERNEEVIDDRKGEKDAQFLVEAADLSLMEVHMGRLASTSATMQEVKDFGKKMETEHQRAYDELAALAATKGIVIPGTPSEETMKDHETLAEKTGYEFDRKVCDNMVDSHDKAIRKFENAAEEAEDADIKSWAAGMLPNLRAHHEEAKLLKEKAKDLK